VIVDWPIQVPANLIGQRQDAEGEVAAPQRQNQASSAITPGITWESLGSLTTQQESSPTPPNGQLGGGCVAASLENALRAHGVQPATEAKVSKASRQTPIIPKTEAAQSLAAINVLPDQVAELADTPITVVNDAIRDGQSRPYVRDLAGWVVTLLRAQRDQGWKIIPPAPRHDSPEALREAFGRYAAEQEMECHEGIADDSPPLPPLAPLDRSDGTIRLWNTVLAIFQHQLTRQEFTAWIRPATLHVIEGGIATIVVPNIRIKEVIEGKYRSQLRDLLAMRINEPVTLRVVLNGTQDAAPVTPPDGMQITIAPSVAQVPNTPDSASNSRPDWIGAERWDMLPAMVRAALIGSTLEDSQIRAASPYWDQLLHVRYAEAVAALLTA